MAKLFDAVNRFRKIEEVTSTKDDVPPVYLMDEIVDLAKEGTEAASSVADHINRNLQNRNPIVKWKAMKLIKHLCNKGCHQFQRSMQRYASVIRELVHWRGEPDPFKGDALNVRVRELAKEIIELLYSHVSQQPVSGSALQGRIQGFGGGGGGGGPAPSYNQNHNNVISSNNASSTGLSMSGGASRMMAFGSNDVARGFMGNNQTSHSRSSSLGEPVLGSNRSYNSAGGLNASGGSFGPQGGRSHTPTGFGPDSLPPHLQSSRAAGAGLGLGGAGGGMSVGEAGVVDDMCGGGGLRPQPTSEDLRAFVQSVGNMDGLKIAEHMISKLSSDKWQVVFRCLCALEAVLDQGMTQSCGEVAVMFQSDPTPVQIATTHNNAQVRQQAAKCVKMLTGEEVDVTQMAPASTATAKPVGKPAAAPAMDLLGDLADPVPAAPAGNAGHQQDLFGGVTPAPTTAAATSLMDDPFAVLDQLTGATPAATASVPAVPTSVQFSSPTVPTTTTSTTTPASRPALDDLFSSMTVSGPTTTATSAAAAAGNMMPHQVAGMPGMPQHAPSVGMPMQGGNNMMYMQSQAHQATGLGGMGPGNVGMGMGGQVPSMMPRGQQPQQQPGMGMYGMGMGMMGGVQGSMGMMGGMSQPHQQQQLGGMGMGMGMGHMGAAGGVHNHLSMAGVTPASNAAAKTTAAAQDAAFDFVKAAFK